MVDGGQLALHECSKLSQPSGNNQIRLEGDSVNHDSD